MTIGENIRDYRKSRGLTQKELAEKVGVATITIQQYERNVREPRIETLSKIGAVLGVMWYDLYPDTRNVESSDKSNDNNYESNLAAACKWLEGEQCSLEHDSGYSWSTEERNQWLLGHFEKAAKMFDVEVADLEDEYPLYIDDTEYIENWMPENITLSTLVDKKQMAKIFLAMEELSPEGQQVAVDRVEELAQIPKYQRTQSAPQDAPTDAADKTPAEK